MCCCHRRVWLPPKNAMQVACSTQPPPSVLQPQFLIAALQGSWWRILALILSVWLPTDRAKNSQNSCKIPRSMFCCTSLLTSITKVKTAVKEKWKRQYCTGAMTTLPDSTSHFCRNEWAWDLVIMEPEESQVFLSCITFLYHGTAV